VRDPFDSDTAARRYAAARLYYHRSALDLAREQQEIGPAKLALDVGCGTGLSTRAVSAGELRDQIITATAGFFSPDVTAEVIFGMRVWTAVRQR
jgi:SAM-dependent methyltransferase